MEPDKLFEELWGDGEGMKGPSEEFLVETEQCWRRAKAQKEKIKEAVEKIKMGRMIVKEMIVGMEGAREDVFSIEKTSEGTEREIRNKKEAIEVLEDLMERICMREEEIACIEEPWLESMEEVKKIEKSLEMVGNAFKIENKHLLGIPAVEERLKRLKMAVEKFVKKSQKWVADTCRKSKKLTVEEMHGKLARYSAVLEFLTERKEEAGVVAAYTESVSAMYKGYYKEKSHSIIGVFEKGKGKENLGEKIEEAFRSLFQLVYSLVLNEASFLGEVLLPEQRGSQAATLHEIFRSTEAAYLEGVERMYAAGWKVPVINLECTQAAWIAQMDSEGGDRGGIASPDKDGADGEGVDKKYRSIARSQIETMSGNVKKHLQDTKAKYLAHVKKNIGKEYGKEGALDLDKVYFSTVDYCKVREVNTKVAKMNLAQAGQIQSEKEKAFQVIKRGCIVGAMQTHYLERKEYFDIALGEVFEEEMEKISKEFLCLAEEKVFEKNKTQNITKRAREIMNVLHKIEGPLGFKLQIDFKDMVLSRSDFHQRNEIAKALTENTGSEGLGTRNVEGASDGGEDVPAEGSEAETPRAAEGDDDKGDGNDVKSEGDVKGEQGKSH